MEANISENINQLVGIFFLNQTFSRFLHNSVKDYDVICILQMINRGIEMISYLPQVTQLEDAASWLQDSCSKVLYSD